MNTLYADIIVDISHEKLDRTFQYRVPESLRGRLEPGACVMIPFGNGNRLIKGYVVALGETCQFAPEKIKDIAGMPEKETGVEDKMIALAAWIRRNYGCTMIQALKTVLPAKQSVKKLEHRQLVRLMNREEILSLLGECERKKQVAKARLLKALSEHHRKTGGQCSHGKQYCKKRRGKTGQFRKLSQSGQNAVRRGSA